MKSYINKLEIWVKNGSNYWLVIVPLFITIISAFLLRGYSWGLNVFRLIGIIIEILGLLTVAWSLSRESKKYNHPGYFKSLYQWVFELRFLFSGPKTINLSANLSSVATCTGHAAASVSRACNTIDEKVEFLIRKVDDMEKQITENSNRIDSVRGELSVEINKTKNMISAEIVKINNELKDKAIIDYCLLISGVLLTIIGMIMTNLPDNYLHTIICFNSK
jgi:hypothetical protein